MLKKSLCSLVFGVTLIIPNLAHSNLNPTDSFDEGRGLGSPFEITHFETTETNNFLNFLNNAISIYGKFDSDNGYVKYLVKNELEYFLDSHTNSVGIIVKEGVLSCIYDREGKKYILVESTSNDDEIPKYYCRQFLNDLRSTFIKNGNYNSQ